MKTVVQELLEELKSKNKNFNLNIKTTLNIVIELLEENLEKERQQIIDAYYSGFDNGREVSVGNDDEMIEAEDYFNNTYKK